jgi:hypothetical protein
MKAILTAIGFQAIAAASVMAAEEPALHGKGMELYSWKPKGTNWYFSLIVGLNNRKPVLDIADVEKYAVVGVPALEKKLSKLAKGERVYWYNLAKEPLPQELERDVRDFCRRVGVELKILPPQNRVAGGIAPPITNVPLTSGATVPYWCAFYITIVPVDHNRSSVNVRSIKPSVADGQEPGVHGGWARHSRDVSPIRQEEENVISAIAGELRE